MSKERFQQLVDKSQTHRKKAAQHKAAAELADAKLSRQRRKDEDSRKIELGALALQHMRENPDSEFHAVLWRLLNRNVRTYRRHLFEEFGIPARPPKGSNAHRQFLKQTKAHAEKVMAANDSSLKERFSAKTARQDLT